MTTLTDTERDSLTECECGHFANEHNGQGCAATDVERGTWQESYGDYICDCLNTPDAIRDDAIATMLAAREQAATLAERARLLGVIEAHIVIPRNRQEWEALGGSGLRVRLRDLIAQERAR